MTTIFFFILPLLLAETLHAYQLFMTRIFDIPLEKYPPTPLQQFKVTHKFKLLALKQMSLVSWLATLMF